MSQPSPLTPARQHALALASSGDLAGARAVLERAVELGKVNLSEDDPDVLRTAYQLGTVLQRADDPAGARRVLEEAYGSGLWRLGDADPLMLEISHDIGVVAEELGNRHEARKAFGRVADLGPGVLGEGHWAVVRARAYLGVEPVREQAAPGVDEPTASLPVVASRVPGRGTVQPPSPENQRVWRAPDGAGAVVDPVEAPTVVQPIITPRAGAGQPPVAGGHGPRPVPPAPRAEVHPPVRTADMAGFSGHFEAAPLEASRDDKAYRKGLGLFAAVAAVMASVIAVAALVFVLAHRDSKSGDGGDVPTLGGPPPSDVRVRDSGSGVEIQWQDPSNGTVSFMVAMGRQGEELKPIATLGPGQTSYQLGGLNATLNYCFTVIAVYRSDRFATSPQTCTSRGAVTPRGS